MKRTRRTGLMAVGTAVLFGVLTWPMSAASEEGAKPAKQGDEMGVPQSPEEHFARAAAYTQKAAAFREEAAAHRRMFADYEKSGANPIVQGKTGREAPWVTKMRGHCDNYIKEAERLAAEADRFAEFHRMRGAEMLGK